MTSRSKDEAEGFLSRWSQRKHEVEQAEASEVPSGLREETAGSLPQPAEAGPAESEPAKIDPEDLPDIDTLEADSDFTVFMDKGVPEAVTRRALRRLWRLDPVFGHLDGLNDYDLDYTDAATVVENLKTIYQVGKGMVLEDEDEEKEEGDSEEAEIAAEGSDEDAAETVEGAEEAEQLGDASPEGDTLPQVEEGVAGNGAVQARRPRNPGDAVVSGAATRRNPSSRPAARSARSKRWGEVEG